MRQDTMHQRSITLRCIEDYRGDSHGISRHHIAILVKSIKQKTKLIWSL